MAPKTGARSPGEALMTPRTSPVAVSLARDSRNSTSRASLCAFRVSFWTSSALIRACIAATELCLVFVGAGRVSLFGAVGLALFAAVRWGFFGAIDLAIFGEVRLVFP